MRLRPQLLSMSERDAVAAFVREAEFYANRYNSFPALCSAAVPSELAIVVILPCINEPDVTSSLASLYACAPPVCGTVEILVLINASDAAPENVLAQNERTLQDVEAWASQHTCGWIQTHCILVHGLARKHAGAGWARKLAMDEAVRRFASAGNADGVIACFDADAVCSTNYLTELEQTFADRSVSGCAIYFEHRIDSQQYSPEHLSAIAHYELHLRYLVQAMKWAGAPYAYHTVGSSMAVRVRDYIKIGGMNRRQAGEDFYFLHKIIPRGTFSNLTKATVFPSARLSDRVPFGTGAAMRAAALSADPDFKTYQFESFKAIKSLFAAIDALYHAADTMAVCAELLPVSMCQYLVSADAEASVAHIKANCASIETFRTRFIEWFNAFRLIKYLNWLHTETLERSSVVGQSRLLLMALESDAPCDIDTLLQIYRMLDRKEF